MQLVTDPAGVPRHPGGNYIAIGKWDGMHLGHQSIVRALVAAARAGGGQSVVVGFHPLPMAVLRPAEAPAVLQLLEERCVVLGALGVDVHLVIPFTMDLAATPAETFAETVLIRQLGARAVMVGFNHTFGRGGQGTARTLQEIGARHGVPVHVFEPVRLGGETVSSTAVRYLLASGDLAAAGEMLGRPFALTGTVVAGDKRGRLLGFPTANLNLAPGRQLPATGVYAVSVATLPPGLHAVLPDQSAGRHGGMLNLGYRPTFQGRSLRCEVHLLDFSGDLYGQRLQVDFIGRIRSEQAFAGVDALAAQLRQDEADARRLLAAP